jgi:hypothetical protein
LFLGEGGLKKLLGNGRAIAPFTRLCQPSIILVFFYSHLQPPFCYCHFFVTNEVSDSTAVVTQITPKAAAMHVAAMITALVSMRHGNMFMLYIFTLLVVCF